MAMVNCSECGKEISDKAKVCPHCGYKKEGNLVKFVKNPKNRIPIIAGGIVLVFLLIILAVVRGKMDSPFERINEHTTRKEVIKLYGKGDKIEGMTGDDLFYRKSKFWGLNGALSFYFLNEEIVNGSWSYSLKGKETFDDYNSQITKIIEYYTGLYGKPEERNDEYTWYDESGNSYILELADTKIQGIAYKAIRVTFRPY